MAKYQGKNVSLNSPRPIRKGEPGYGRKKSVVYVSAGEQVKRVMFGDPNMSIKKDQPGRRKNFRARHNCDNPGPKTKARYWSCKAWSVLGLVTLGMMVAWNTSSVAGGVI